MKKFKPITQKDRDVIYRAALSSADLLRRTTSGNFTHNVNCAIGALESIATRLDLHGR